MSASYIMLELFDRVKDQLPADQLNRMAAIASGAEEQAGNLATTLAALALLHDESNQSNIPCINDMGKILFGLAHQAETISALVSIGNERSVLARLKQQGGGHA